MQGKRLIAHRLQTGEAPVVHWWHTNDFDRPQRQWAWERHEPNAVYTNEQTVVGLDDWRGLHGVAVHVTTTLGKQALQELHSIAKQHFARAFYGLCIATGAAIFQGEDGTVKTEKELEGRDG